MMVTQDAEFKPQQMSHNRDLIRLQWAFLRIITCLVLIAMVMPTICCLILYNITKNPYISIPSAIIPTAIGVGLGFAIRHMAIRIFPKSPDELRIDEIKAKNIPQHNQSKIGTH